MRRRTRLGGVHTAPVDVPIAQLTGQPGPSGSTIWIQSGSEKPFTAAQIAALYPSRAADGSADDAAVAKAVRAGFALPADRAALLAYADPSQIPG